MTRTLSVLLVALASLATAAPSADFFVSPSGDDANPGSRKQPFATIGRAQQAVRALDRTAGRPVRVLLRGGLYPIREALLFTPADSGTEDAPVVWAAYPGEQPIVTGGRVLDGWQETEDGLWSLEIPEVKAGDWFFWQLFQQGRRLRRCREPDTGYFRTEGPLVPRARAPQQGMEQSRMPHRLLLQGG